MASRPPLLSRTTHALTSGPRSPRKATASSGVRTSGAKDGQNTRVDLSRISWLVTALGFAMVAVLLFLDGYVGYFLVFLAVAASAAVNLR